MVFNEKINKYNNQKTKKSIIFSDIETIMYEKKHYPYAIGWVYNNTYDYFITDRKELIKEYSVIKSFFEKIENYNEKILLIYFHNLSNFDGIIILKVAKEKNFDVQLIEKDNIIYEIKIKINKKIIILRDSLKIIPISLEKIGLNLCDKNKKMIYNIEEINLSNIKDNYIDIEKYLKQDVYTLKEGFENFGNLIKKEFDYDINYSRSISSITFNIFRKDFYDIDNFPIFKNNIETDQYIRKSYIGGIVEVYKPELTEGYYYDVNSLYPYAMLKDMPIGKPKFIKKLYNRNIDELFGFFNANIIAPNNLNIPFLPYRDDSNLLTPLGKWNGTYFSEELKHAKKLGYTIMLVDGYEYDKGKVLENYINTLYNKRKEYNKKHSMNYILKLLLNSLYGRFGMKINSKKNKIINEEDIDKYRNKFTIRDIKKYNDKQIIITYYSIPSIKKTLKKKTDIERKMRAYDVNAAVQIASAITSYARIHMHKFKNNNTYYTDTDSIFSTEKIKTSNEIGEMKLEDTVKKGYFIAPKTYVYTNKENIKKITFKGINDKVKERISIDFFIKKIKGDSLPLIWLRESSFRKNYKELTLNKVSSEIINTIPFKKREKIFKNNKWVDTKPLKIIKKFKL